MRGTLGLLLAAALIAGCARKGDPLPPEGARPRPEPRLTAPSVATDPIRRGQRL